jgi:molecular chaperone GrpE (heat shock protein)
MTIQDPKEQESTILDDMENATDQIIDDTESIGKDVPADASEQVAVLHAALARSQADYQNLLMRVERDKADMAFFLSAKMLTPLLTQVDNLERAVKLKESVV